MKTKESDLYLTKDTLLLLGYLILLLAALPMGLLIGSSNVLMWLIGSIWYSDTLQNPVKNFSEKLGSYLLKDNRNAPYLPYILWNIFVVPVIYTIAIWHHKTHGFQLSFFLLFHFIRIGPRYRFFAHTHVLVHKEGHDYSGFWQGNWKFFNCWLITWVFGPFYGLVSF